MPDNRREVAEALARHQPIGITEAHTAIVENATCAACLKPHPELVLVLQGGATLVVHKACVDDHIDPPDLEHLRFRATNGYYRPTTGAFPPASTVAAVDRDAARARYNAEVHRLEGLLRDHALRAVGLDPTVLSTRVLDAIWDHAWDRADGDHGIVVAELEGLARLVALLVADITKKGTTSHAE